MYIINNKEDITSLKRSPYLNKELLSIIENDYQLMTDSLLKLGKNFILSEYGSYIIYEKDDYQKLLNLIDITHMIPEFVEYIHINNTTYIKVLLLINSPKGIVIYGNITDFDKCIQSIISRSKQIYNLTI